jgi:hypothetical protein
MDSGKITKEKNELEESIKQTEDENQAELEIDEQINILAFVLIELLIKDIK